MKPPTPTHAPPAKPVRLQPPRISGLDLKHAEHLTRRLLLHEPAIPTYTLLPPPPDIPALAQLLSAEETFPTLHPALDPASRGAVTSASAERSTAYGVTNPRRAGKKRAQIRFLIHALAIVLERVRKCGIRIADMCAGCGHVGLVAAAVFPHVHVTLVDENATALAVARKRGDESGLTNVAFLQSDVRHVQEAFDVVIALHACGGATDAVLSAARQMGAAAIVVPCCVGGLVACRGGVTGLAGGEGLEGGLCGWDGRWDRAKSFLFRGLLEEGEYKTLARAADFGEGGGGDEWRFVAKSLVECDRMRWMEGEGYVTELVQMPRWTSPKNDVLIMWCGKEGEWRADEVANGFVRDVVEGSVLRGLGESEVAEVGELLKDVVAGGTGVYVTPRGVGKRRRKVVHGVAEGLGLAHESVGRGVDRVVVVRRSDIWPVFSDGYVGIGGAEIEKVCQQCVDVVPGNMVERKILRRGRPHHITLVGPTEMGRVGDARDCARAFYDGLRGTRFTVLGVGRVRKGMTGWDGVDVEDVEEAWFVVVDWPEAQAVRRSHGLPSADLHITLGFANKDVHQVRKGASTLVSPRRMESVLPIGI